MLSILSYLRTGNYLLAIIVILSRCFVVFCCTPMHEFAHGYVAYKLGDPTAKNRGRLTLNPFAHLDPIGALMIFLVGIGYAKPVPVNARNLKNPKRDTVLVSLAGPISNVLMAFIYIFATYIIFYVVGIKSNIGYAFYWFFSYAAQINVTLAVFNLFPIPPLDGSKILLGILPTDKYFKFLQYERYIMLGLLAMLFLGVLDTPIMLLSDFLIKILSFIPSLIFRG